jgi:hypothetical protein
MNDWRPIGSAPRDGREIQLGWLPNGRLEHSVVSRWNGRTKAWLGQWTPTHWRPVTTPTVNAVQEPK